MQTFDKLQVGWIVKLKTSGLPESPGHKRWYGNEYMQPDQIGRVTELYCDPRDANFNYATIEIFDGGTLRKRYVQNIKAEFTRQIAKAKEFEDRRADYLRANFATMIAKGHYGGGQTGSDPEVFVVDKEGKVIPAWKYLPNKDAKRDGLSFWDGFQAEFVTPPQGCHGYFIDHIRHGLFSVYNAAKAFDKNAKLCYSPVVDVPEEMMKETSDEHAALGCAPSMNVYPDVHRLMVEDPRQLPIRFAGCHIHMGYGPKLHGSRERVQHLVSTVDKIYGVMSVAILRGLEDPRRRKYYGMAGEFRLPAHGLEYRVPSSALLCHPAVTHLNFDLCRQVAYMADSALDLVWESPPEKEYREIINDVNVEEAIKVVKKNEGVIAIMIKKLYLDVENKYATATGKLGTPIQKAMDMIMNGAKNVVDVSDMEKNWYLNKEWTTHSGNPGCKLSSV